VQADVDVVGNTVDRVTSDGFRVANELVTGGHLSLDVFDDVFAHTGGRAIRITSGDAATRTVRAGSNAFFDNGVSSDWDGASPGTGNVTADPRFVDEPEGKLGLRATSPLLDAGLVCTPGGVSNLDALRHGRLSGASVDIGAYERGSTAPTGQAYVGTGAPDAILGSSGADIVCGMGGGDVIAGFEGDDYLDGGPGPDQLVGHAGADRLFGGKGDDPCLHSKDGVEGNDSIDGGKGTDGVRRDAGDVRARVEVAAVCS
jgi:Ca2+-binding RTX toxin-like protein